MHNVRKVKGNWFRNLFRLNAQNVTYERIRRGMLIVPINGIYKQVGDMRQPMKSIKTILVVLFFCQVFIPFCPAIYAAELEKVAVEIDESHQVVLTSEERAWRQAHPVVRLGVTPDWPPFDIRTASGAYHGINADYISLLSRRLGLAIEPRFFERWEEVVANGRKGKVDGVLAFPLTEERLKHFLFTSPYVNNPIAGLVPADAPAIKAWSDLDGKTVILEAGSSLKDCLLKDFPGTRIIESETTADGVSMLAGGKGDIYLGWLGSISHEMREYVYTNVRIAFTQITEESKFRIGVHKSKPLLRSMLERGILSITPEEHQAIRSKWLQTEQDRVGRRPPITLTPEERALPEHVPFDQNKFLLQSLSAIFVCIAVIITIVWLVAGRPRQLSIRNTLLAVSFVFTALVVSSAAFVIMLLKGEENRHAIAAQRAESLNLALELKQSSDDLTRFARTYVVTGDPKYEQYFRAIIAIRDGKQAHPKKVTPSYWDYVAAGVVQLDQDGDVYSIERRMTDLELTEEERAKLSEAKRESDTLINLENIAMNAVKGLYKDDDGHFTIKGEPDMAMARALLHGKAYHDAKDRIMKPIDQFFSLLEWRTTNEVNLVHHRSQAITLGITILITITTGFSIYVFFLLRRRIISPLAMLEGGAQIIKRGDYSHHINLTSKDEVGNLAKVFNSMASSIEERTQELQASESHLSFLLSSSPVVIYTCSATPPFGATYITPNIRKHMGFKPEQLTENSGFWAEHIHPEDRDRVLQDLPELFEHGIHSHEYRFHMNDGSYRWMHDELKLIRNETGEPIEIIGYWADISHRKQMEDELRKLSRATEASPACIVITDSEGTIEYVNPKFVEVTGYTAEEAVGKNPRILQSGEQPAEFYTELWETITAGREWRGEMKNKKKNGELYWESASISPIRNAANAISHFIAVKQDITARKHAEEDLQRNYEALERFRKLAVEREITMVKLKEEVNELLNQLGRNKKYKIVQ